MTAAAPAPNHRHEHNAHDERDKARKSTRVNDECMMMADDPCLGGSVALLDGREERRKTLPRGEAIEQLLVHRLLHCHPDIAIIIHIITTNATAAAAAPAPAPAAISKAAVMLAPATPHAAAASPAPPAGVEAVVGRRSK